MHTTSQLVHPRRLIARRLCHTLAAALAATLLPLPPAADAPQAAARCSVRVVVERSGPPDRSAPRR